MMTTFKNIKKRARYVFNIKRASTTTQSETEKKEEEKKKIIRHCKSCTGNERTSEWLSSLNGGGITSPSAKMMKNVGPCSKTSTFSNKQSLSLFLK